MFDQIITQVKKSAALYCMDFCILAVASGMMLLLSSSPDVLFGMSLLVLACQGLWWILAPHSQIQSLLNAFEKSIVLMTVLMLSLTFVMPALTLVAGQMGGLMALAMAMFWRGRERYDASWFSRLCFVLTGMTILGVFPSYVLSALAWAAPPLVFIGMALWNHGVVNIPAIEWRISPNVLREACKFSVLLVCANAFRRALDCILYGGIVFPSLAPLVVLQATLPGVLLSVGYVVFPAWLNSWASQPSLGFEGPVDPAQKDCPEVDDPTVLLERYQGVLEKVVQILTSYGISRLITEGLMCVCIALARFSIMPIPLGEMMVSLSLLDSLVSRTLALSIAMPSIRTIVSPIAAEEHEGPSYLEQLFGQACLAVQRLIHTAGFGMQQGAVRIRNTGQHLGESVHAQALRVQEIGRRVRQYAQHAAERAGLGRRELFATMPHTRLLMSAPQSSQA